MESSIQQKNENWEQNSFTEEFFSWPGILRFLLFFLR
jgi:hypothetical protein